MTQAASGPVAVVLFDLDDTLYDHSFAAHTALEQLAAFCPAFAQAGIEALASAHHEFLTTLHPRVVAGQLSVDDARRERFRLIAQRFAAPSDETSVAQMVARYRGTYERAEQLVPGVQVLLVTLRRRGLRLGVISNSTREEQIGKLSRLGILDHFEHIVVSGDHGINKPDRRLFDITLRAFGLPATQAVFVGDNWHADVEGARSAGLRAVWFNRFNLPAADPTVEQLHDFALPGAIDRLLHGQAPLSQFSFSHLGS